jgi:hypothetical protein
LKQQVKAHTLSIQGVSSFGGIEHLVSKQNA